MLLTGGTKNDPGERVAGVVAVLSAPQTPNYSRRVKLPSERLHM